MSQSTRQKFNKRGDLQDDSINVGTSSNDRIDPIPISSTFNSLLPKPLRFARNTRLDQVNQNTESRASQTLSSSQIISSTSQVIYSGLSSIQNVFSGKNKRKASETDNSDDEASSSSPGPQKKTRGLLKRHDSEEKIAPLSSMSPKQSILSYLSDFTPSPITNIHELDGDAMLEEEEVFKNHQNRYQDNLGPLFTPLRQSARLEPNWVLSYPSQSQVQRESKKVSIQDSYLSDRSSIKLEHESDQDFDRTCIKLEHESDQDSDRVSIKIEPPDSASDEEVYPNVKLEEYEHKVSNIKSEPCTDASQASTESKEHQSNSETSISHREYVPLSKSLHQPRSQSDENYVSSYVDNVNPSSTGSSSLYTRKNQVRSSSSRLQTDSYEKDALSDRLQYQDNEKMDLDLPRTSQKRKGKRNEDSSKDKKQKGKAKDDAGTKSEIEQVTSTIGISTPVLPYDPIDDYQMEPVNPDKHLLTFPFKKPQGRNSVIVYKHDEDRLNDKRFLNDTLLEVFPKIWTEQFPSASIHTFSPFFFTKLCGKDLDAFKYDDVKRWTKDDDIFKKKVLIVPINQSNHWYILLVTNPGYCIQGDKSNEFREGLNSDYGESNNSRPKTRKRMINPGTKLNQQKPYIFVLDPLGITRQVAADKLKSYLKKEALSKLGFDASGFVEPEVVTASCPTQTNFTDCGVYCLHYIWNLYQNTDTIITTVHGNQLNDLSWDAEGTLPVFRLLLRRTLKYKIKEYRE